jgi:hypothetical protein
MSLLKCPECGHDVSEYAKACPNCGCPIEKIQEIILSKINQPNRPTGLEDKPNQVLENSESPKGKRHLDWKNNVIDAIILFSIRLRYLPPNQKLSEDDFAKHLKEQANNPVCRQALEALHDYGYRQTLEAMKNAHITESLKYISIKRVSDSVAKHLYKEYKAYKVMDAIHSIEGVFKETILDNPRAFLKDFIDKDPKDANDVGCLAGLNSHFQDAEAMISEVMSSFCC